MTEVYEDDWLVRVRAQVMCRDEGTGGWLPLGGGGLSNVMVRKRPTHVVTSGPDISPPLEAVNGSSTVAGQSPSVNGTSASQAPRSHAPASHPLPPTTTSTPVPTPTPPHSTRGHLNANNYNNQLGGSGGQLETAGLRAMDSSNSENGSSIKERGSLLKFEYFIYGKRISDQSVVLSCTIKKDFQYNKVMPTFHHWVTDEKRFGLTFQTAADARAFDKGVRTAIEDLLDGLGGAWPSLHTYKQFNPAPKDDEDDHIFECLNLPSDSRSSSENSTASRSHQRRPAPLPPVTNPGVFHMQDTRNIYKDTLNLSASARELLLKRKLAGSCSEEPPMFGGDPLNPDNYSYVQIAPVSDYTVYPSLGGGRGIMSVSSDRSPSQGTLQRKDSGSSLKKRPQATLYPEAYRPALKRDPKKPTMEGFHARLKCRHCQEWYMESSNKPGSCEYAPDCFRTCINGASCIQCAQCMLYHCMSDAEGDFATHPLACNTAEEGCTVRWIGLALLSLVVPCLWCYPPLKAVHWCCVACGISGGKHMPLQRPLHAYPHH